jgi:hypothetical protein
MVWFSVGATENHTGSVAKDSCEVTTSIPILFRLDKSVIDSTYMENGASLARLGEILGDEAMVSQIDSIRITGTASPEGNPEHNYRLSGRRAIAIYSYITAHFPDFDERRMRLAIVENYWNALVEVVEADVKVPAREQLLDMLQNEALDDLAKSQQLKTIGSGKTFAYLRDSHLLSRLRRATTTIEIEMSPVPEPQPQPVIEPEVELQEPEQVIEPQVEEKESEQVIVIEPEPVVVIEPARRVEFPPFALRTNLLLDAVGGPNIGVDVLINDRISVGGDFAWAYTRIANLYALQTLQGTIEGRYWFRPVNNILTGWNVGVYTTYCSRFDIQWGGGYQGDGYWSAGVSGGYSWRLTDKLNLDVSALVGAVWTPEVRYYDRPQDGHLMWTETRYNATRLLPTMLRANLVWLIGTKNR